MALIPSFFGGRRSNIFDPFSLDIFDPFEGFGAVTNAPSWGRETAAVANPRVSWKETPEPHVIKVDLPGLKKEEVKVEVEDGRCSRSAASGAGSRRRRRTGGTARRGAAASSSAGSGCRRT
ncbi:hypothetical protein RJ639_044286 [Escallonia herrerae]|uniref:SHSP domain-containing protein n=1 Tax=Escallonia herrerae TaxID=1293975 RepID=A0AA88WFM4_9ASTE|nr:hypothetical protein RJ639_044286 [Escallonia herrerae]